MFAVLCSLLFVSSTAAPAPAPMFGPEAPAKSVSLTNAQLERSVAWLAHMKSVVKTQQEDVAGIWFRSWRKTAVSTQYSNLADTFDDMSREIELENLRDCQRVATKLATNYRLISEYMLLGGSETVNDGTGAYTAKIAELLEKNAQLLETRFTK